MENFDKIFILLSKHDSTSLNTNILETGLINIIALLGILVYTGKDFLGSILEERKTLIVSGVQDAEDRLNEAQKRLNEAKKQLSQSSFVIAEIKVQTTQTKKTLLDGEAAQTKKDLINIFDRALATFYSKERQVFLEIKQQIIFLTLQQIVTRTQKLFVPKEKAATLIDETISKLKGDLL